jgi:cystathionine gamma-synthase
VLPFPCSFGNIRADKFLFTKKQLAQIAESRFGLPGEKCFLYPSHSIASDCHYFLSSRVPPVDARIVEFVVRPPPASDPDVKPLTVFPVFIAEEHVSTAKQFWQHTGSGISSRFADRCLQYLDQATAAEGGDHTPAEPSPPPPKSNRGMSRNRHYAKDAPPPSEPSPPRPLQVVHPGPVGGDSSEEQSSRDFDLYVEERYGRNLSLAAAPLAKSALRRRIAGVLKEEDPSSPSPSPSPSSVSAAGAAAVEPLSDSQSEQELKDILSKTSLHGASDRGVKDLDEDDVYLYPAGMSAIWHSHQLIMKRQVAVGGNIGKSVCFG